MRNPTRLLALLALPTLFALGCKNADPAGSVDPGAPLYEVAGGCYVVGGNDPGGLPWILTANDDGTSYDFGEFRYRDGTPFRLRASDLGSYLLYDDAEGYLASDGVAILRETELLSDVLLIDDAYESPAEWEVFDDGTVTRMRHKATGGWFATGGLVDDVEHAAQLKLLAAKECAEFPELTLDAKGKPQRTTFEDGSVFGIVDTHSHILSNFAFGGGGLFHGAPFHPLGVEHALSDCDLYHGEAGRKDLFGFGFQNPGDITDLILAFVAGELAEDYHETEGYPEFTEWPNAPGSPTHQVQYWRWLERAWLGGLRLMVQHATSNQIICDMIVGLGAQQVRYACNDMVAVDRIIDETYAMERYIDAQYGGPGQGFFRVVTSPAEAREVIEAGKMAIVLGIEASNLFDCFLISNEEFPACTEADVIAKLDEYQARGVRAIFPVHKYDNHFSAGDGHKGIIELGNFVQTGHRSNFVSECIDEPAGFDGGAAQFAGIISPRDDYFGPPPHDMSGFATNPVGTIVPFINGLLAPPTGEEVCQKAGITDLGEFLVEQMMLRGLIIEVDHLPRHSYRRVYEMLEQYDYPAAGTHGRNNRGRLYALGGVSKSGFATCRSETETATVDDGFQDRIALIEEMGGFPAEGFGFDLNGFAGARGPRFGPNGCSTPQDGPVTYPFESYAGDTVFFPPSVGNRALDFNTEGLVHIGLLPELIQDVRGDGVTDAELEPLFKSAEGYLRMWEKAEARAAALAP